jgi:sugar phosphate isomerase/epimerase
MKLCTTTGDFAPLLNNDFDKIKELSLAGFKYVDFSMYGNETRAYMGDNWKEEIKKLKDYALELGIQFVQAHSPAFETLETLDPNENFDEKLKETIRSIEVCKELDIPMTVVHAGVKRNTGLEETYKLNRDFYNLLVPTMEKTGVKVLVENVGINDNNGRHYLNSAERLIDFINYFNHPLLQACWDVGHANVFENQYDEILKLKNHLLAIHYNDNDKKSDLHTIPFLQTLDNDKIVRALIDVGFKGPFTFECTFTVAPKLKKFEKQLDKNLNSLKVARAYEKALFETGKYLLQAYDIYEE